MKKFAIAIHGGAGAIEKSRMSPEIEKKIGNEQKPNFLSDSISTPFLSVGFRFGLFLFRPCHPE